MSRIVLFLSTLITLFLLSSGSALAQDSSWDKVVYPAQSDAIRNFSVAYDPNNDCNPETFKKRMTEEAPPYRGGRYSYSPGYSTDSYKGCPSKKQLDLAKEHRGPDAKQFLIDNGWPSEAFEDGGPVPGEAAVRFQLIINDGDDGDDALPNIWVGEYQSHPTPEQVASNPDTEGYLLGVGDKYTNTGDGNEYVFFQTLPDGSIDWRISSRAGRDAAFYHSETIERATTELISDNPEVFSSEAAPGSTVRHDGKTYLRDHAGVWGVISTDGKKGDTGFTGGLGDDAVEGLVIKVGGRYGDYTLTAPKARYGGSVTLGFGLEVYVSENWSLMANFRAGRSLGYLHNVQHPMNVGLDVSLHRWCGNNFWFVAGLGRDAYRVNLETIGFTKQELFGQLGLGGSVNRFLIEATVQGGMADPLGVSGQVSIGVYFADSRHRHRGNDK